MYDVLDKEVKMSISNPFKTIGNRNSQSSQLNLVPIPETTFAKRDFALVREPPQPRNIPVPAWSYTFF